MLKNYMEDVVLDVLRDITIKSRHPECCFCEKCTQDIIALSLSRLKGKYAASLEGEIFARVEQSTRQVRADALLAVMEAINIVAKNPRHSGGSFTFEK